jgi:hypothetical protein
MHQPTRPVRRVLVMLDYGPEDPESGEVFDLTAIALEIVPTSSYSTAEISLNVRAQRDYTPSPQARFNTVCSWSVNAGNWMPHTARLDDAINSGIPDSPELQKMQKRIRAWRKKADKIEFEAKLARLEAAAALRSSHPIARFTEHTPLTAVSEPANP